MRVFRDLTDIVLDAPNAYHTLSKFVECGVVAGFVPAPMLEEIPSRYVLCFCLFILLVFVGFLSTIYYPLRLFPPFFRGRKRYVSEGDGGAVKLPED